MEEKMRLQKAIAHLGYCSRRKAEEYILANKVKVNGMIVNALGTSVSIDDKIEIIGLETKKEEKKVTYLFNKPLGVLCTVSDDRGRKTIVDFFKTIPYRVYPVGRLDFNTSGAILVSNDGELANLVTHPSTHLDKTYIVTIKTLFKKEDAAKLENGVMLEDGLTAPAKIKVLINTDSYAKIMITIHEGRNRQVRRMFQALDYEVKSLHREQIGFLSIDRNLERGEFRLLTEEEVRKIKSICLANKKVNVIPDYKKK